MKGNLWVQPGFSLSITSPSPICTFSSPPNQRKRRSSRRKTALQGTKGCHSFLIPGEVTFRREEEAQSRMRKRGRQLHPSSRWHGNAARRVPAQVASQSGAQGGCPLETQPFHSLSSLIFPTAASGAGYCLRCQVEILSFPPLSIHRQPSNL